MLVYVGWRVWTERLDKEIFQNPSPAHAKELFDGGKETRKFLSIILVLTVLLTGGQTMAQSESNATEEQAKQVIFGFGEEGPFHPTLLAANP